MTFGGQQTNPTTPPTLPGPNNCPAELPLSGKTILPTRTCFDDALEYLEWIAAELLLRYGPVDAVRSELLNYTVVHAICLHPEENHPFAHGWVEHDGEAIEAGILDGVRITYAMPLETHNAKLRVQERTEYTMPEIIEHNYRTGHTGPWIERYAALCAEGVDAKAQNVHDANS